MPAKKKQVYLEVEKLADICRDSCSFLWDNPEVGGEEKVSAGYMRDLLRSEGFTIVNNEKLEHAFYAEYGSGHPVIAILGEYDALPGLSQKRDTVDRQPVQTGAPGHGCGHNLIGSAAATAAIALKNIINQEGLQGTIRFYGCPEEELLSGKVKMAYYGMFDGCDLAISWHPMTANAVMDTSYLACAYAKFYFTGTTSHAAFAPHLGRSALDAMELMNVGVNYLREHVIDSARIHYATDNCGYPPNIVPGKAVSWYCIRAPKMSDVRSILQRIEKIAKGAAMMTETTVEMQIEHGCCELHPNTAFSDLTYTVMKEIPLPVYTDNELQFAAHLQTTVNPDAVRTESMTYGKFEILHTSLAPRELARTVSMKASSDSGDVSFLMPMNLFTAACWPFGVAPHTWQATAASGSRFAAKGALYAAKVIAGTAYKLMTAPEKTAQIIKEFKDSKVEYSPMYKD